MAKCIVVLGMHRSGTSASTGVLHMLGVNLGTNIMPPSTDNPKGYFENLQVYEINESILKDLNSSWDNFLLDLSSIESTQKEHFVKYIQKFIKQEFAYSDVFAIKDPRICLLFPLWEEALSGLGIEIEILIPLRNPMEVAKSLKKRNDFSINKGLALWLSHFIAAEKYSRNYKRLISNFDSLINDTKQNVRELASFLDLTYSEEAFNKAIDLIEQGLVHHKDTTSLFSEELPSHVKEIFETIFSNPVVSLTDIERMDYLYQQFQKNIQFLFTDDIICDTNVYRDDINDHMQRISELQSEVEEKNRWASGLDEEVKQLRADLEESVGLIKEKERENVQKAARINELQSEVEERNRWASGLDEEVSRLREKLKESVDLIEQKERESATRILELQREVEEKNRWASELDEEVNQLRAKLETLIGLIGEKEQYAKELESRSDGLNEEIQALRKHLQETQEHIALKEAEIADRNYEFSLLHEAMKRSAQFENESAFTKLRRKHEGYYPLLIGQKKFKEIPPAFIKTFDAMGYLRANHDVAQAIVSGEFADALEHFLLYGYNEIREGKRRLYLNTPFFNEENYLAFNADVQSAIKTKKIADGFTHFLLYGHEEIAQGRRHYLFPEEMKIACEVHHPETIALEGEPALEVPFHTQPTVSIIIPAYNQAHYTYSCVRSIIENTGSVPYEIIVMDDNSPDESAKQLDRVIHGIRFVSNDENLGFLRNCNKGASFAAGRYLFFLNNDTQVQPGWLENLVSLMESDPSIGMSGSKLVYPDGRLQEAGGIIWNDASGWNYGRLDDPSKPEYNYVKDADYISGAAIMIRTELWREIGGFDERFVPAYYEDTDLAFEVRKRGKRVVYQPASVVVHFEGVSNGTDLGSGIKQYQVVNYHKFFDKWKEELERFHFPNAQNVFQARDRSRDKKTVLFIDHYLPHYDQDAGSKAAYQYLKLLASSGMNVKFMGDNFYWYPGKPYLESLQQMGIEVLCGLWYKEHWEEWLIENAHKFDYFILSRPHIAMKYLEMIKQNSKAKILYFGVDLHYLREAREYEIKKDEIFLNSSRYWQKIEYEIMEQADISYFYSSIEVDEIKKNNSTINAKMIPLYIFDEFKEVVYSSETRKDIMFVGGFSHSPNIDAMLWFVYNIWDEVVSRLGDVKLYIIGSNPPDEIMELARENIIVTGFVSDEDLEGYFARSRMMVAPLRYGAGMKGKVVQAMYEGIPVVTTSIGAEGFQKGNEYCRIHFSLGNAKLQMADIY